MRYMTLSAPADSPAIVTFEGSPPKALMLRLTHLQRFDLIEQTIIAGDAKRRLIAEFGMREPAEDAQPIVDGNHDDASAASRAPS